MARDGRAAVPRDQQEIDQYLDHLRAQRQRITANLLDLENSVGHKFLSGASLRGETQQGWQRAQREIAELWRVYDAYQRALGAAEQRRASGRLGDGDRRELTRLLWGPSVELAVEPATLGERGLLDPAQEAITLHDAVDRMTAAFDTAVRFVADAEAVWSVLHPLLEDAERLEQGAGELAAQLPAPTPELEELRRRGRELARTVRQDPMSLRDPDSVRPAAEAVRTEGLEDLRAELQALCRRLEHAVRLRTDYAQRSRDLRRRVADLAGEAERAVAERRHALAKISAPHPEEVADPGPVLRRRLDDLERLYRDGDFHALARAATEVEQELDTADAQVRRARDSAAALLRRRGALRGRLDAYRAKAVRLGRAEHEGVQRLHQTAQEMLWTAPCDLNAAEQAVLDYQRALNDQRGAPRDGM